MTVPNRAMVGANMDLDADLSATQEEILVDPQTSGGLLVAVPSDDAEARVEGLREAWVEHATIIGTVKPRDGQAYLRFC